jgi:hypothetical protein
MWAITYGGSVYRSPHVKVTQGTQFLIMYTTHVSLMSKVYLYYIYLPVWSMVTVGTQASRNEKKKSISLDILR